jgi:cytochrome c-type biogenesis protein CcmH
MMLWLVLALMTGAAMFAVLWPLARADRKLRSGSDVVVYRDQLDEVARDLAAGRIGEKEAEAARVEVSRRLIAAADAEAALRPASSIPSATRRRAVAVAALVVLSVGCGGLYLTFGSPSLPGQPIASRDAGQSIEALVGQVEDHLAKNPADGRGWDIIAPIYLRLGRFDDAVRARRNALVHAEETSDRQFGLGEALFAAANNFVTPEAKQAFERAVALDAGNIRARYFIGIAAEQAGKPAEAAAIWRAMLANAPPDAPWTAYIRDEIARVAGSGPNEEQVAAASNLGADERSNMIRGMVERLAERLRNDGSDLEGWLRLVQSYKVLGEREKALAAAADARRALASDPQKLRQVDELVKQLGLEG